MSNKRISDLAVLTSASVHNNDLLLVSDVTDKESKQMDIGNLGRYYAENFKVNDSYYSDYSDESEYAIKACSADSAEFAITASALSKPYYPISVKNAESASYASVAKFAYGIFDTGSAVVPNALTSSFSLRCLTASYIDNLILTQSIVNRANIASVADTASYAIKAKNADTSSLALNSLQSNYATLANSANSSVLASTASFAVTASYIASPITTIFNWINPASVYTNSNDSLNNTWSTISLTGICPTGTWAAVADIRMTKTYSGCGQAASNYLYLRKSSIDNIEYKLFESGSVGNGATAYGLWIPVSTDNSIDIKLRQHSSHWTTTITIVGYLKNG